MSSGTGNGSVRDVDAADAVGVIDDVDAVDTADAGGISGDAAFPERTSRPEILAPAGTIYSMIAGLRCGADAVYAGASRFGARAYAGNFSDDELAFGIDMAHTLGSCVHVTMNTLYRDEELKDALRLLDRLYREGADAIIVQDVGFLSLVRRKYPEMPIHASTQMTVCNRYHAAALMKDGVRRVVPARENTIEELKRMKETGAEVECFIHGALCICYSGQCLFSSIVGGRSGNRGQCAQPCRKKYDLVERRPDGGERILTTDGKYLLSPRDLNASKTIFPLIDAGMDSFKIEGRMKKPEYVAGVVSVYRGAVDRYMKTGKPGMTKAETETLRKIFNRDFTDGYFFGNPQDGLMSRRLPYNRGLEIGKVIGVNENRKEISVALTSSLSARDGIAVSDIGKKTNRSEDPRVGAIVKKMYAGGQICDKAVAGEVVNISADVFFTPGNLPAVGDIVYKTLDDLLHREIDRKMPELDEEEIRELIREGISSSSLIEKLGPGPRRISVRLHADVVTGKPLRITVSGDDGASFSVESDYVVEQAQKNPFTQAKGEEMLSGLGSTVFDVSGADVSVSGDNFVPVGVFKELRNQALSSFVAQKIMSRKRAPVAEMNDHDLGLSGDVMTVFGDVPESPGVTVVVYSEETLRAALSAGASRVYAGGDVFTDPVTGLVTGLSADDLLAIVASGSLSDEEISRIWFRTPSIVRDADVEQAGRDIERLAAAGVSRVLVTNPGILYYLTDVLKLTGEGSGKKIVVAADSSFNVFNSASVRKICSMGASGVTLSNEVSVSDIRNLTAGMKRAGTVCPLECLVHGRIRLMITEHPLVENACLFTLADLASARREASASGVVPSRPVSHENVFRYFLRDMKDFEFPLLSDQGHRTHVFNSKELNACDLVPQIRDAGISYFRIDSLGCSAETVTSLVNDYRDAVKGNVRRPAAGDFSDDDDIEGDGDDDRTENDSIGRKEKLTHGNFLREII